MIAAWARRAAALVAVGIILAAAYLLWFRNSSLVAADSVAVRGVTIGETERIRKTLARAGRGISTLNPDVERIEDVAASLPTIAAVEVETDFPGSLTIRVREHRPALVAEDGARSVAVARDGRLLTGVPIGGLEVPELQVSGLPASGRLTGKDLKLARVLGAAPEPLRPLIEGASEREGDGVVVVMEGGIELRFGDPRRAAAKWRAAAAVLADPETDEGIGYLDLRAPGRPASGHVEVDPAGD